MYDTTEKKRRRPIRVCHQKDNIVIFVAFTNGRKHIKMVVCLLDVVWLERVVADFVHYKQNILNGPQNNNN